jgi:hypothetical protein
LFLVVLGTVVAAFAGRLRIPAPSLLVIAGVVVGLLPGVPAVRVTPDVVSLVVLPPLLYAASEELPWRDLLAVWRPVIVLAVGLVLASAAAVGAVAGAVAGIPASMAFVLGAVLASTDPVAVSALGRRLSLPPRVQALVQAESLFNDATSLVLFQIAVSFAVAGTAGRTSLGGVLLHGAGQFAVLAAGPDPRPGPQRGVARRGAGGGRDADRGADGVGVPAVRGHPAARGRPTCGVAGACRGVLGGRPRGRAAGRGVVYSAGLGERGAAAAPGPGPGDRRRGHRHLAHRARAHPATAGPPGRDGPAGRHAP